MPYGRHPLRQSNIDEILDFLASQIPHVSGVYKSPIGPYIYGRHANEQNPSPVGKCPGVSLPLTIAAEFSVSTLVSLSQ